MSRLHVFVLFATTVWSIFAFTNSAFAQSPSQGNPLAIDVTASGNRSSAAANVRTQYFSTSNANELLLAFVSADSSASGGNTVTSVNGGGLTWQLVARANNVPGDAEIWRAWAPGILSNVRVTANLAQSVAASITVVAFSGADASGSNGSGAIGASGTFSSVSGAPSGSVVTTRDNSWVFAVGTDWDNAIARTAGADQTILHQYLAAVGDTYWVQRQNTPSAPSGTTVTMNDTAPTSDKYDLAVVEVLPATTVNTNPDFTLSVSPSSQSVQTGGNTTYTATIAGTNGYSGAANLSVSGLPNGATGSFNPSSVTGSGTSQLAISTTTALAPGNYPFTITAASGSLSHSVGATLVVSAAADFSLTVSPASQSVQPGSTTTYTASIAAQNGYTGTASLSVSGLPSGATANFNPGSVTGAGTSQLTITTTGTLAVGNYPLTVTGTSGTLTHSTALTLVVTSAPDFTISVSPSTQSVAAGSSVGYTATIAAQNGYSGTSNLSVSGLPSGVTGAFSPASVSGSGTTQLNLTASATAAPGTYAITITAASGSLTHSITANLVVSAAVDFSLTVSPSSQSIQPGATATYGITISGMNGYAGSANLTVTGLPTGAAGSFNPASVNGSGTSQLTVTTVGSTPSGTYPITVSANAGTLTHTASASLIVSAAVQHTVGLSWTDADSGLAGFNVYRSNQNGSGYLKLNTSLATATSYTDSSVQSGSTYYYVVTAVNTAGIESAYSVSVQAAIP